MTYMTDCHIDFREVLKLRATICVSGTDALASASILVKLKHHFQKKSLAAYDVQTGHQTRRVSGHLLRDIFYVSILA